MHRNSATFMDAPIEAHAPVTRRDGKQDHAFLDLVLPLRRKFCKTCTTDIYLHNECAHVGLSVHAPGDKAWIDICKNPPTACIDHTIPRGAGCSNSTVIYVRGSLPSPTAECIETSVSSELTDLTSDSSCALSNPSSSTAGLVLSPSRVGESCGELAVRSVSI